MNIDTSRLSFDEKKHAYKLDGTKLLSGVTTVISETSSKGALVQWAANEAAKYLTENIGRFAVYDGGLQIVEFVDSAFTEVIEEARTAHLRKKDKAASKGTDTHALVEEYIKGCIHELQQLPEFGANQIWERNAPIQPFVDWATENKVVFLAAEQRLYSEKYGYAGTADFIAIIDGKLTIGDLKTFPKMWSPDAYVQTAAYAIAFEEMTGEKAQQTVIVKMCDPADERIKKYGGKPFAVYSRYALDEDADIFLKRLAIYRHNQNFVSPD